MMNKRDCYHFLSSLCPGHTVFTSVMPSISSPRLQSDCKPVSSLFESLLCLLLSTFCCRPSISLLLDDSDSDSVR
jgi:hypothetical protein